MILVTEKKSMDEEKPTISLGDSNPKEEIDEEEKLKMSLGEEIDWD